jgi:hypothetical protein
VTYAVAQRLVGTDTEDAGLYPDREVWLVVMEGTGCAVPSGRPGAALEKPRYCWSINDATSAEFRPSQVDWQARHRFGLDES